MHSISDNISVTGNTAIGGDASVSGDCRISGSLRIQGHLDAPNVLDAMKGLFPSVEALRAAYPYPADGAMALVGSSLPATLYRASRRAWISTGKLAGDLQINVSESQQAIEAERLARAEAIAEERRLREDAIASEADSRVEADNSLAADIASLRDDVAEVENMVADPRADRLKDFAELVAAYHRGRTAGTWHDRILLLHVGNVDHQVYAVDEIYDAARLAGVDAVLYSGGFSDPGEGVSAAAALRDFLAAAENVADDAGLLTLAVPGSGDMAARSLFFDFRDSLAGRRGLDIVRAGDAGLCCYCDITSASGSPALRIVCIDDRIDSRPVSELSGSAVVRTAGFADWLINTLLDAAENQIPVITLGHVGWGDGSDYEIKGHPLSPGSDIRWSHSPFLVPRIIDAMVRCVDLNHNFTPYGGVPGVATIAVNRQFSSMSNPLRFVCHLFGHNRARWSGTSRSTSSSDAFDLLMLGEEPLTSLLGESRYSSIGRMPGTKSEIAFSLLAIDPVAGRLFRIPYGAWHVGSDLSSRVDSFDFI